MEAACCDSQERVERTEGRNSIFSRGRFKEEDVIFKVSPSPRLDGSSSCRAARKSGYSALIEVGTIDRRSGGSRLRRQFEKEAERQRERERKSESCHSARLFLCALKARDSNRSRNQNGRLLRTVRESSSEVLRRTPRPFHEALKVRLLSMLSSARKTIADQSDPARKGGKAPSQQLRRQSRGYGSSGESRRATSDMASITSREISDLVTSISLLHKISR